MKMKSQENEKEDERDCEECKVESRRERSEQTLTHEIHVCAWRGAKPTSLAYINSKMNEAHIKNFARLGLNLSGDENKTRLKQN